MNSLVTLAFAAAAVAAPLQPRSAEDYLVSLGPRPYYLINNMTDGPLKTKLQSCENLPQTINKFSIGHRGGGTLQFPEETKQSEDAGARMGAGVLECDVSFTADRKLVCRHSLCDLHTTTNILLHPELAAKFGHHGGRVQQPVWKARWFQCFGNNRRGLPTRHSRLANRAIRHLWQDSYSE